MHSFRSGATLTLFTTDGRRKYLTPAERRTFIETAWRYRRPEVGALCLVLAYTGCRISEALALTGSSIDSLEGAAVIRCLKKRGVVAFRQVPLPPALIQHLAIVPVSSAKVPDARLWSLSRSRAWQLVKAVMVEASIPPGPHRSPKGLRHGFGIHAVRSGVPPNLVQRWLGHASFATTAIYLDAIGEEERQIASRMWSA